MELWAEHALPRAPHRVENVYKSSLYGGRETPEKIGSASKAFPVVARRSLNPLSQSMDALSIKALANRAALSTPPTKVMSFGARTSASGPLRSSIPSLPLAASQQLDQHGRPQDPGSSLSRKSLQPPPNPRSGATHLTPQPFNPQRNATAPGGRPRQTAPVVTPVLGSRDAVCSRVRAEDCESSDSSECIGSNTRWGSVCAEDSASTLDDTCSARRHSVSARPSELKSLLELTHTRDQQLQQQTQALQDERASWSGTVSRLKEAESAAQHMRQEREALEIDVQILRQKLAALECSGNAVATTSSVFQQMLTKSVTERLILASDTNVALQGVSSMQEQLRVALQMLSSSDAQLKDAVCLVQGLRERLDLAEARVTQLQLQASHDDLTHRVKEAELLQLGADSLSKAETLQARSTAAERRTEELQIDIETLNQQFEWLQHQAELQQAQAWQKEQLLQLQQQQLAAATAAAGNTQLARSEEQSVMKGRLCKLEDDLAAAVAATVQERVQTMMKTRRADQQAKVIYGLQQRELELSQEKEELLSELTLPSPRRCELEREVHQLKVASQERRQALLETQQHLQAAQLSLDELRSQLRVARSQLEEGLSEKVEMQERGEEAATVLQGKELELAAMQQHLQTSQQGQEELRLQLQLSCSQLREGLIGKADSDSKRSEAEAALLEREQNLLCMQHKTEHLKAQVDAQGRGLAACGDQIERLQEEARLQHQRVTSLDGELQGALCRGQAMQEQTDAMKTNEANLLNRLFSAEGERQVLLHAIDQSRGEATSLRSQVDEVSRLTEDVSRLNTSGEAARALVQEHVRSLEQSHSAKETLEAEVSRLQGIEETLVEVCKIRDRKAGQLSALREQMDEKAEEDHAVAAEMRLLRMQAGENTKLHLCIDQVRAEMAELQHQHTLSTNKAVSTASAAVDQDGADRSRSFPTAKGGKRHLLRCVTGFAARLIFAGGVVVCTSQLVTFSSLRQASRHRSLQREES